MGVSSPGVSLGDFRVNELGALLVGATIFLLLTVRSNALSIALPIILSTALRTLSMLLTLALLVMVALLLTILGIVVLFLRIGFPR